MSLSRRAALSKTFVFWRRRGYMVYLRRFVGRFVDLGFLFIALEPFVEYCREFRRRDGLAHIVVQPTARHFSLSSSMALAVIAIMGMSWFIMYYLISHYLG